MKYYLKLTSLTNWGSFHAITEIEAYSGTTKVPLVCEFASSTYTGWNKENLTDGVTYNTVSNTCWLDVGNGAVQHLIFTASTPFDSIKVYAGTAYNRGYGNPKDVEIYTMQGETLPSVTNSLWSLRNKKTYDNVLSTYIHDVSKVYSPQPIHRWRLDKDATDSIGGLVTTNNGGVTFDSVNGASFNGVNQWLSFTKALTAPFSISLWAKFADATTGDYCPIGTCTSTHSNLTNLEYFPKYSKVHIADFEGYSNSDFTPLNYPSNKFILCSATYDGIIVTLRRGIDIVFSQRTNQGIYVTETGWAIGKEGNLSVRYYFKGNMLDARMYNTVLLQSDIATLVAQGANGDTPLVPYKRPFVWIGGI